MNLYTLGVKHTVIVDDFVPLQKLSASSNTFSTIFSNVGQDSSFWGVVLEKAFAKVYGNYNHLISGDPREATRALIGAPSIQLLHNSVGMSANLLWD